MAKEDLIPMNERTEEEQKRIATMGGIASGEARRKKKKIKEDFELLLSLPVKSKKTKEILKNMGIEKDDALYQMALVASIYNRALNGDKDSIELILNLIGENPNPTQENDSTVFNNSVVIVDDLEYTEDD